MNGHMMRAAERCAAAFGAALVWQAPPLPWKHARCMKVRGHPLIEIEPGLDNANVYNCLVHELAHIVNGDVAAIGDEPAYRPNLDAGRLPWNGDVQKVAYQVREVAAWLTAYKLATYAKQKAGLIDGPVGLTLALTSYPQTLAHGTADAARTQTRKG